MTKQWLMRRAVRMPVVARDHGAHQLVGMQAALHQRLGPPAAHQLDRLGGRIVAVRGVDDLEGADVERGLARDVAEARGGADQDGLRGGRSRAASTALSSETASQGWATAVSIGGCLRATAISRSYFFVRLRRRCRHARSCSVGQCEGAPQRRAARRRAMRALPSGGRSPEALSTSSTTCHPPGPLLRIVRQAAAGWPARPALRRGAATGTARGTVIFSSSKLRRRFAGCMLAHRLQHREAPLVDAPLRQAHMHDRADHRLEQAAGLELLLEVGAPARGDGILARHRGRSLRAGAPSLPPSPPSPAAPASRTCRGTWLPSWHRGSGGSSPSRSRSRWMSTFSMVRSGLFGDTRLAVGADRLGQRLDRAP